MRMPEVQTFSQQGDHPAAIPALLSTKRGPRVCFIPVPAAFQSKLTYYLTLRAEPIRALRIEDCAYPNSSHTAGQSLCPAVVDREMPEIALSKPRRTDGEIKEQVGGRAQQEVG